MQIDWSTEEPSPAAGQLWIVPVRKGDETAQTNRFGAHVQAAAQAARFAGKSSDSFAFTRDTDGALQHVVLLGIGEGIDRPDALRQLGHDAARRAEKVGAAHVIVDLRNEDLDGLGPSPAHAGDLFAQGAELGTYSYDRFRSEEKRTPSSVQRATVVASSADASEGTTRGQIVAASVARARDLGNGPAELVTPTFLADTAREIVDALSGDHDVSLQVFDRAECQRRNMGCYLGVAKGSTEEPRFIHLQYKPKGPAKGRVVLVGKGVTFDSGGYSIKPTDGMLDMKLDMCGSAAVIGAFEGAVKLGIDYELHVLVAATENMVSGHAYRLGDVLTASNGKTVEINNTDAEGRLTMADALVYAGKLEPDFVIDFATLTGACIVALGPKIAGVMTHDEKLWTDWSGAADRVGDRMWRLPLPEDLKEQLESKVADFKNTGERWGGALTAGLFLSEFTEGQRWMHVDIAGPAIVSKPHGITTPGASGFPVATILELLSGDVAK